ncbi:hypothetical protein N9N67_11650, partial [Bacteriovoracaceae bacterium]|nr:hypothetical protein [Bacteriovoracaceae bacterium]
WHKLKKKLKLNWEIIDTNNVETIIENLRDESVQNLIIISHTNEGGQLTDAHKNIIPLDIFNLASSQLKSLGIYSCNGDQLRLNYQLDQIIGLKPLNSIYYVSSRLNSNTGYAPDQGFLPFLKLIDRRSYLEDKIKLFSYNNMSENSKLCSIIFPHSFINNTTSGTTSFSLNKKLIHAIDSKTIHSPNLHQEAFFDCNLIQNSNIIEIENINGKSAFSQYNLNQLSEFSLRTADKKVLTPTKITPFNSRRKGLVRVEILF